MFRVLAVIAALTSAAYAQTPYACTSPEHRAFDFWIGEWDVYVTGTERLAGRSSVRSEDAGCVVTEHWQGPGFSGRSLNSYDRFAGSWSQFWTDSGGEVTRFVGGPFEGGMRLTDPANVSAQSSTPYQARMTFTPNADGSVRQHGETSFDGITWTSRYDYTYRRRAD